MAAPQIACVAALLKQVKPDITVDEIRSVLQNTGTTLGRYKVANAEVAVAKVKASVSSGKSDLSSEDRLAVQQFSDVSSSNQFFKEISWLKNQGITTGWSDETFRPDSTVSYGAMAAFFYRMAGSPQLHRSNCFSFQGCQDYCYLLQGNLLDGDARYFYRSL